MDGIQCKQTDDVRIRQNKEERLPSGPTLKRTVPGDGPSAGRIVEVILKLFAPVPPSALSGILNDPPGPASVRLFLCNVSSRQFAVGEFSSSLVCVLFYRFSAVEFDRDKADVQAMEGFRIGNPND
jgi:hypothetical protein